MTDAKQTLTEKKEKPRPANIYKTLSSLQWCLKLSAASHYYQNSTGEFKRSFLLLLYATVYLSGFLFFGQDVFYLKNYYARRNSFRFAYYLEKGPFFTKPISIICSQIFTGKKIESLQLLDQADEVFLTTDQTAKVLKANRKIKSLCEKLIITTVVSLLGLGIVSYLIEKERHICYFIARYIFTVMLETVQSVEFAVMCYCIRSRFKIINQIVKDKIEESERVEKYPINRHLFIRSLKLLLDQHERLRHVAEVTNAAFSVQLLCVSLNALSIFISNGIKVIIIIFEGSSEEVIVALNWICAIIFVVEFLAIICHHVNELCSEANYTIRLLHGIQLRIDDTESIKMMILSTMHLDNNKLKLMACKLFKVDFSLLLYICGGAMSYLVITYQFVQFKELQKERLHALSRANDNITVTPSESLFNYYSTAQI
ncbi:uncharacterized protein LOC108732356 isoform X2 [Agrilus planipennis]|uniref:Gustatory receptor n=1 Tax=Agrilus planipennis TaxID=224129 RepID=A0A1W4WF41_AGRPL|nr:uncharacterized protein LOC108732356 isoform X2 [Agrilus planipennis]